MGKGRERRRRRKRKRRRRRRRRERKNHKISRVKNSQIRISQDKLPQGTFYHLVKTSNVEIIFKTERQKILYTEK
jgi:hypothetical protein